MKHALARDSGTCEHCGIDFTDDDEGRTSLCSVPATERLLEQLRTAYGNAGTVGTGGGCTAIRVALSGDRCLLIANNLSARVVDKGDEPNWICINSAAGEPLVEQATWSADPHEIMSAVHALVSRLT